MKKALLGIVVIAASVLLLLGAWRTIFRHRTEIYRMQTFVKRVQLCDPSDVTKVTIYEDPNTGLELRPKEDLQDITRLVSSVKRATVESRERNCSSTGKVTFTLRKSAKCSDFNIQGNFNPENAPVVTAALRSDDLGAIVQDIIKRKSSGRRTAGKSL